MKSPRRNRFRLIALAFACAAVFVTHRVEADQGFYLDYVIINGSYYKLIDTSNSVPVQAFQGSNLGSFNPATQSLTLTGFEANTFQNNGSNVYETFGAWAVTPQGTGATNFSNGSIGFNNASGSQNKKFNNELFGVNLLSGLSNGTYTLTVFEFAHASVNNGSEFTIYDSNNNNNYTATFTVVPEPSTWAAGTLALAVLGATQRRRFSQLIVSQFVRS